MEHSLHNSMKLFADLDSRHTLIIEDLVNPLHNLDLLSDDILELPALHSKQPE
jgi:hypothetical protein